MTNSKIEAMKNDWDRRWLTKDKNPPLLEYVNNDSAREAGYRLSYGSLIITEGHTTLIDLVSWMQEYGSDVLEAVTMTELRALCGFALSGEPKKYTELYHLLARKYFA